MKKNYISICKVVAIFFVILIHIISKIYSSSIVTSSNFKIITFLDVIARFCVPIFIMCSGSIFLNRNDSSKKMIFKYSLRIYIIFIIFNFIYKYIYYQVLGGNPFDLYGTLNCFITSIKLQSIFQLWYLRIIFILYLLTPLIKLLRINKIVDTIILFILFISSTIITNYTLLVLVGYIFYYYAGYYFSKYNIKNFKYIFYILGIISIVYTYYMTLTTSINLNSPTIVYIDYLRFNIMIYSISIFIFIKNLSYKISKKTNNLFNNISNYVFGIYLVHGLVIGVLNYLKIINIYDINISIYSIIINTLLVLFISYLIVYIYYYIKKKMIHIK